MEHLFKFIEEHVSPGRDFITGIFKAEEMIMVCLLAQFGFQLQLKELYDRTKNRVFLEASSRHIESNFEISLREINNVLP